MSNRSRNKRGAPNANDTPSDTPTAKRYKRRQEAQEKVASGQQSATSAATTQKRSKRRTKNGKRRKKNGKRRPREQMAPRAFLPTDHISTKPRSRNSSEALPALVEPGDDSSPSVPSRTMGTVGHPENERGTNLIPTSLEPRSPMHPSSHNNTYQDTYRYEPSPQLFSAVPAPASSYPAPSTAVMECAARTTSGDTPIRAQETPTDMRAVGEWRVVHEAGYSPVISLSYVPPMKKDVGVFPSRGAAVRHGQELVGSTGGYTWGQVRDSGNLEIAATTSNRWEICWKPPDSEYSRVTATLLTPGAGRWIVDVERGNIPDGVHSYVAPTKNTLGPFQSREIAVARAKKEVGGKRGLSWVEVVRGGDFENREDSANRWEGYWEPPDSEYSHVIVKLLVVVSADSGNGTNLSDGNSWNNDQQPTSSTADLKQTTRKSSGSELPVAF